MPSSGPTGAVLNPNGFGSFVANNGVQSGLAVFLFATLSGQIDGWSPNVPSTNPSQRQIAQPGFTATDGAKYTGLAIANNGLGSFLYAADFRNGKIDVINNTFQKTTLSGSFKDPNLPAGYAPYNIQNLDGKLYVTYAKVDAKWHRERLRPEWQFVAEARHRRNFQCAMGPDDCSGNLR
jgi:uncharacterized protein (TIGR03118 family)